MMSVSREKFLTVRWNNILSLGVGLPTLAYILAAFSSTLWTERAGLIWLAIIGVLY